MIELICIVCPKGCRLMVDKDNGYAVTGQGCERGEKYGRTESQNPVRVVTSTVRVSGGTLRRCPVKTKSAIPKEEIFSALKSLDGVKLVAPVREGQIIIGDVCGTGVPFIATRDIENP